MEKFSGYTDSEAAVYLAGVQAGAKSVFTPIPATLPDQFAMAVVPGIIASRRCSTDKQAWRQAYASADDAIEVRNLLEDDSPPAGVRSAVVVAYLGRDGLPSDEVPTVDPASRGRHLRMDGGSMTTVRVKWEGEYLDGEYDSGEEDVEIEGFVEHDYEHNAPKVRVVIEAARRKFGYFYWRDVS